MKTGSLRKSHRSSVDEAYTVIQQLILTSKLSTGQKLTISVLEKKLQMSKTPIVTALMRLVDEGLVTYKKNHGYFVKNIDASALLQEAILGNEDDHQPGSNNTYKSTKKNKSLIDITYENLRDLLLSQKFSPGQKLIYSDLEKLLGVSKTPIVNALSRLENDGYVELKRNIGYYIREFSPDELRDILEARFYLEMANLPLIIEHVTDEDLDELDAIHDEFCNYHTESYSLERQKLLTKFHLRFNEIGRNKFIYKYIENIYEWLNLRVRLTNKLHSRPGRTEDEHGEILNALRRRDKEKVESLVRNHLLAISSMIEKGSNEKKE